MVGQMYKENTLAAIGDTPLIKLEGPSKEAGCTILGKAEMMNPGGSVKDRAALSIINKAEARGELKPNATIVEGTAGNTGIALAMVAKARGYKCKIVIPNTQSQEKKDAIRLYGAELIEVPPAPFKDPANYVHVSRKLAEQLNEIDRGSALWANQFDNTDNRLGHYETTGPEIWEGTNGKLDGFICAVGSGGTLAGAGSYLQERNVRVGIVDPDGAALYDYYVNGELKSNGKGSITEGIGQGRITANLEGFTPNFAINLPDTEMMRVVIGLMETDGLCLGGSGGLNVAGAIAMGKDMGPGHTIVTVLCDHGSRYASKLFNKEFLQSKSLPIPSWL
ncbi:MAG: cysteine synthase A [Alphaproteobacteria bacterium]